jgi:hypothetical protein
LERREVIQEGPRSPGGEDPGWQHSLKEVLYTFLADEILTCPCLCKALSV